MHFNFFEKFYYWNLENTRWIIAFWEHYVVQRNSSQILDMLLLWYENYLWDKLLFCLIFYIIWFVIYFCMNKIFHFLLFNLSPPCWKKKKNLFRILYFVLRNQIIWQSSTGQINQLISSEICFTLRKYLTRIFKYLGRIDVLNFIR